jgi:hypothetical protein
MVCYVNLLLLLLLVFFKSSFLNWLSLDAYNNEMGSAEDLQAKLYVLKTLSFKNYF